MLERVDRDRAYADLALRGALRDTSLTRRDRALATELCYGTLRNRGRLDAALAQVLDRPLAELDAGVVNLLRIGAYQILFLSLRDAAAVDEAVKLARRLGQHRATGLVNAVLRKLSGAKDRLSYPVLEQDPVGHLESVGSLPRWLAERFLAEFGTSEAAELARALGKPAPRTVRVSPGANREALQRRLKARPCAYAPDGLTEIGIDPVRDPGFDRGEFSIQDEASQLVAHMLGAQPGETVVDCCAAPGTKAVQLAQSVGPKGEVIALDVSESRLPLIGRGARRLGLKNVRILQRDIVKGFDLQGQLRFPRILVDAPCSGLGVLRRNPDARWRIQPEDVSRLAEQQLSLLRSAARYVEPGGVLLYSVCTFTPEETTGVLAEFLNAETGFRRDDATPWLPPAAKELLDSAGDLRTLPHRHGCDGFFAVRLVRA